MTLNELFEIVTKAIEEIHGERSSIFGNMTLVELIESHRSLQNLNIEWNGAFREAQKEGYDLGYKKGLKSVQENTIDRNFTPLPLSNHDLMLEHLRTMTLQETIMLEDLRKMTLQEIANLIGTDD